MSKVQSIRSRKRSTIPAALAKAWLELRRDRRSSASAIVVRALAALEDWAAEADPINFVPVIEPALVEMVSLQPHMASLVNLANHLLWAVEGDRRPQALQRAATAWREKRWREMDALTREAAKLIAEWPRVVTVSRSGAVESAILQVTQLGVPVEVILMESRPLREGLGLAKRLASAGVRVRLRADAAIAEVLDEPSIVLLGADAVVKKGVVNKIGSRLLTAEAKLLGRPCFALATADKLWPEDLPYPEEKIKPAREIARGLPPGVIVENKYFETVPLDRFRSVLIGARRFSPDNVEPEVVHSALSARKAKPIAPGG